MKQTFFGKGWPIFRNHPRISGFFVSKHKTNTRYTYIFYVCIQHVKKIFLISMSVKACGGGGLKAFADIFFLFYIHIVCNLLRIIFFNSPVLINGGGNTGAEICIRKKNFFYCAIFKECLKPVELARLLDFT